MVSGIKIRKSLESDTLKIYDIVNEAYKFTVGTSGEAFKTCDRFKTMDDAKCILNDLWVGELNGDVVAVVGIKAKDKDSCYSEPADEWNR